MQHALALSPVNATEAEGWIQAGRHGTITNVTHYRAYPADPVPAVVVLATDKTN